MSETFYNVIISCTGNSSRSNMVRVRLCSVLPLAKLDELAIKQEMDRIG